MTSVSYLALPVSSAISGPLLARALRPSGRGELAAVLAPISLANILFALGVADAITYFVARRIGRRRSIIRLGVLLGTGAGVAAAVLLWLLAPVLLRHARSEILTFRLLAATLPLSIGFASVRGAAAGIRQFGAIAAERVTGAAGRVAALAGLFAFALLTPGRAAAVTVTVPIAASLILIPPLRVADHTESDAPNLARRLFGYGARASGGAIGGIIILRLDQVLMAPLSTARQLGYYAVAVSLAELPAAAFSAVRDVIFAVSAGASDVELIGRATRQTVLLTAGMAGIGAGLSVVAVPTMFGQSFEPAVPMSQILLVGTIFSAATSVTSAGFLSIGRPGLRTWIQLGGAGVTAALVVALVPRFGGIGASVASLVSYAALAIATTGVFSRVSGLPVRTLVMPTRSDVRALRNAALRRRRTPSRARADEKE